MKFNSGFEGLTKKWGKVAVLAPNPQPLRLASAL